MRKPPHCVVGRGWEEGTNPEKVVFVVWLAVRRERERRGSGLSTRPGGEGGMLLSMQKNADWFLTFCVPSFPFHRSADGGFVI